jgi:hypothetical protein
MRRAPDKHAEHAFPGQQNITVEAWKVPVDGLATIAAWLLHVPRAHAFWEHWAVSVIHLRPIDGVPPADIVSPGMTHEIVIFTIDPKDREPDPDKGAFAALAPFDLQEQFGGTTDAQAVQLAELAVDQVIAGRISPDSDYRRAWRIWLDGVLPKIREQAPS